MPGCTPKNASESAALRQESCSRSAAGRPGAANAASIAALFGRVAAGVVVGLAADAGGASRSAHAVSRRSRASVIRIVIAHAPPPTAALNRSKRDTESRAIAQAERVEEHRIGRVGVAARR